ncbi:MAG TPA: hypothetical protein PKE57_01845 [Cellvibrionaceae bacterium]|nr:hypothetical protein [Cellvibrionaceae bacterium]HMW48765.1 hypothetical protein [Cellvibrionaceae bacterium]HMY38060.1 hypothetical protein [Marinagarivorans sp.]HNG61015.1 hypothetical protein [Cellvibrionaceae bacterium]
MRPFTAQLLDLGDDTAVVQYEQAFYQAFYTLTHNRLIRTLWHWDLDQQRLATRIGYEHQRIYVGRDMQGEIAMAIAVNTELQLYQSGAFGFPKPAHTTGQCELLAFFAINNHHLQHTLHFWRSCFKDLSACGFHTGFASSAARLVPVYSRAGGEILDKTVLEGEQRFHWKFDLNRQWLKGQN